MHIKTSSQLPTQVYNSWFSLESFVFMDTFLDKHQKYKC